MRNASKPCFELTISAAVDASEHVSEVVHAQVKATGFSEETVIEVLFVLLGVVRCIAEGVSVLVICVTAPHAVDWLLAGEEVVAFLLQHLSVADLNTDLVELAVPVFVAEHSDLVSSGNDCFKLASEILMTILLLPVVQRIEEQSRFFHD